MKRVLIFLLFLITTIFLTACSNDKTPKENHVTIGTIVGSYTEMVEKIIQPELEKKGYQVVVKRYDDYNTPSKALANGELDANLVHDSLFMANFNEEDETALTSIITVPTAPLGLYSAQYTTIEDVEEQAFVTIPNDVVGTARALQLLASKGLIVLDSSIDPSEVNEQHIVENPKQLTIQPVEPRHLVLSLDTADFAIIPGSFALQAELDLMDALVLEEMDEKYRNAIAINETNKDAQFTKDVIEIIQSKQFEEGIAKHFEGFSNPDWMNKTN